MNSILVEASVQRKDDFLLGLRETWSWPVGREGLESEIKAAKARTTMLLSISERLQGPGSRDSELHELWKPRLVTVNTGCNDRMTEVCMHCKHRFRGTAGWVELGCGTSDSYSKHRYRWVFDKLDSFRVAWFKIALEFAVRAEWSRNKGTG